MLTKRKFFLDGIVYFLIPRKGMAMVQAWGNFSQQVDHCTLPLMQLPPTCSLPPFQSSAADGRKGCSMLHLKKNLNYDHQTRSCLNGRNCVLFTSLFQNSSTVLSKQTMFSLSFLKHSVVPYKFIKNKLLNLTSLPTIFIAIFNIVLTFFQN